MAKHSWMVKFEQEQEGLRLNVRLEIQPTGQPQIVEVRMVPTQAAIGLTAAMFRKVRLTDAIRQALNVAVQAAADANAPEWVGRKARKQTGPKQPGRGRPALPEEFLAEVARDYVAFLPTGEPVQRLARKHGVPVQRARNWVFKARKDKFLFGRSHGVAGGSITAKAAMVQATARHRTTKRNKKEGK